MKNYDVLVAGGGFAGIGAAVGAAREGKKVLLVEQYGCLGGAACHNLVNPFMKYWRVVNGERDIINRGVFERILKQLKEKNALAENGMIFHEEYLKFILDKLVQEYNITVLFHTSVIGANMQDGVVNTVTLSNKDGVFDVKAKMYIDATGDGDLAAMAGFAYEVGDNDGNCQPMTLCFNVGGVPYGDRHYVDVRKEVLDLYKQWQAQGKIKNPRENVLIFHSILPNTLHFNSTRIIQKSPLSAEDLTAAEFEAREQMFELLDFLKGNFELFKDSYLINSAPCIGVRESRRIIGEYMMTAEDVLSCKKFEDGIARGDYPVDIHNPTGTGTVMQYLPQDEYYSIPVRSLIPKGGKNLLVAGRCISVTHEAQASIRIIPIVCCIGEGAGVTAATALEQGVALKDVDVSLVQQKLKANGALY